MSGGFRNTEDQILYKLGQIEAKLDLTLLTAAEHQRRDDTTHTDQEDRIKALENGRSKAIGAVGIITVLGSGLMSWVATHLGH